MIKINGVTDYTTRVKTPTAPTPCLTGTMTLWDFTQALINVIEAEPRRLWMDSVLTAYSGLVVEWFDGDGDRGDNCFNDPNSPPLPDCGTVACIGGWIGVLANKPSSSLYFAAELLCPFDDNSAERQLMREELYECFYAFPDHGSVGTPEYVDEALAPFKEWRERYEDVLKARTVTL